MHGELCLESIVDVRTLFKLLHFNVQQAGFPFAGEQTMNMLGIIQVRIYLYVNIDILCVFTKCFDLNLVFFCDTWQSQKTAELLLDLKVSSIVCSPKKACIETAMAISRVSCSLMFSSPFSLEYSVSIMLLATFHPPFLWEGRDAWVGNLIDMSNSISNLKLVINLIAVARSCRLLGCWLCASLCGNKADRVPWCWKYPSANEEGLISELDFQRSPYIFYRLPGFR